MSGGTPSPLVAKRGRCRSPGLSSKMSSSVIPGTRCIAFLRRCLAIQLQKIGSFPSNSATSCSSSNIEHIILEHDAPLYWMYDSGYLIFQGFLEANLKCFWNGALIEAMKILEFQGYIAPGVLLVTGSPCALEVVRAAWARNVLKPPNNYVITIVGDVEDCLVEPISQGQFTPLPEALCWIILDMTASGQAAVMESICSTLEVAFPDMQKPSKQLVYDTLAKLTAEKKLYQTSNGYFVMTPDKMRLSGSANNKKELCDGFVGPHQKQILLTPDEAVVMMHGEIETVRDGNVTHQAIQTNLADVICGGNPNDKIIYPRIPSRIRSGYSAERLERRHSLRFFGHARRSHSLQRTGSVRHISDKNEKIQNTKDIPYLDDVSRKHTSLFSRLFRRSGRMKRDDSPSSINRLTFSAQFPPSEWFNRGVTHLHSIGTQTTYLAPSTDTLPKRNFVYDSDDISLQDIQHKRRISAFGTPRTIRRTSHSATLPRRTLKKTSPHYNVAADKNAISRISSQTSVAQSATNDVCVTPRTSSHSSLGSSKTVISKEQQSKRASPTLKSLSSTSSGYNSLPRSACNSVRNSKAATKPNAKSKSTKTTKERPPESSFTFHMSAKSSAGFEADASTSSAKTETSATTMTTTINNGNTTKIFVQQQHKTPTRSLITFENSVDKNEEQQPDIIIVNQPYDCKNNESSKETNKAGRPTSLYTEQNNLSKSNRQSANVLETQLRMKCPSTETIQLEEKSLEIFNQDKKNYHKSNVNVLDDLSANKNTTLKNSDSIFGFNSETELNNVKNYLFSQNSNVDKINNLRNKNILKSFNDDDNKIRDSANGEPASPSIEHNITKFNDLKNSNDVNIEKELACLNLDDARLKHYPDFPSLSDLSLRFTSLAAQSILKGVSYNSVDTLVEVNMAAEKKRNCEMSITTDFGVV